MRCSVVIATLGRTDRLSLTLESLLACDPPPAEVIVVDGERADATRRVVDDFRRVRPHVRFAYLESDVGLTVQRNRGLAAAGGEIVVFTDDDMSFATTPALFARIAAGFGPSDVVGVTGTILWHENRRFGRSRSRVRRLLLGRRNEGRFTRFGYPRYLLEPSHEVDVEYMLGGLMCARLEAARRVGFDEALTGYGLAEDEDFSYRLSRLGRIRYLPDIVVVHDRYGPRDLRTLNRNVVVNRTYLFRKNFPQTLRAKIGFVLLIGVLFGHRLVNGEWSAVRGLLEGTGDVLRGRLPRSVPRREPEAADSPSAG